MKRDFRMVEKPTGNVFTQISFKNASIWNTFHSCSAVYEKVRSPYVLTLICSSETILLQRSNYMIVQDIPNKSTL